MLAKMFATVPGYITGNLQTIYLFIYLFIIKSYTVQDRQNRHTLCYISVITWSRDIVVVG